jgi:hypothetical protein
MKKIIALIIVFTLLFPLGTLFAEEKEGAKLIVTKIDGTDVKGELIAVKKNSILLYGSSSGKDESISLEDINTLEIVKFSGLFCGAGLGVALGAIGGGAMGIKSDDRKYGVFSDIGNTVRGGAIGALIGGFIGAMIGYSISGSKTFQIKGKSQEEISAVLEKLRSQARVSNYQ